MYEWIQIERERGAAAELLAGERFLIDPRRVNLLFLFLQLWIVSPSAQPAWCDPSASHHSAKKLKRCQETSDDSFLYPLSSLSALYVFPLAWQPEVSDIITPQILSGAVFSPRTTSDFTLIRHVVDLRAWIVSFSSSFSEITPRTNTSGWFNNF